MSKSLKKNFKDKLTIVNYFNLIYFYLEGEELSLAKKKKKTIQTKPKQS